MIGQVLDDVDFLQQFRRRYVVGRRQAFELLRCGDEDATLDLTEVGLVEADDSGEGLLGVTTLLAFVLETSHASTSVKSSPSGMPSASESRIRCVGSGAMLRSSMAATSGVG